MRYTPRNGSPSREEGRAGALLPAQPVGDGGRIARRRPAPPPARVDVLDERPGEGARATLRLPSKGMIAASINTGEERRSKLRILEDSCLLLLHLLLLKRISIAIRHRCLGARVCFRNETGRYSCEEELARCFWPSAGRVVFSLGCPHVVYHHERAATDGLSEITRYLGPGVMKITR